MASLYVDGTMPILKEWLKNEQNGEESSHDNSRGIRLLSSLGPDALPIVSVLRTDSTSRGIRIMWDNWV